MHLVINPIYGSVVPIELRILSDRDLNMLLKIRLGCKTTRTYTLISR